MCKDQDLEREKLGITNLLPAMCTIESSLTMFGFPVNGQYPFTCAGEHLEFHVDTPITMIVSGESPMIGDRCRTTGASNNEVDFLIYDFGDGSI